MMGVAAGILAAGLGSAQAEDRAPISIAPQELSSALYEFGGQTGLQILFTPGVAVAKRTAGVVSAPTEDAALAQLLSGTGLTYRRQADIVMIMQGGEGGSGPQSASAGDVDALIVTAQKREENIQDVPIAISAFTQEDLTTSQIAGGPDLITQVPNMTFTKTNFSSYSIQLRGIGTQAISATTDPAVAVAFNNTPFIRNRFFEQEFYDLERVEVLRGPQGTLYGRNATAGVVNIISAKPTFIHEAKASADVSNFNSSRIEGMVNIPLVDDAVALRVAGAWTKRDGYATNELTGNPIDGRDLWSTRVSLRVSPSDALNVNLLWEHFEENDDRLRSGKQLCKKDVVTSVGGRPVGYFELLPSSGQLAIWSGVQATFSQGCERVSLYSPEAFETPNGLMLPYYIPLGALGLPVALSDPYINNFQTPDLRVIESGIDPEYWAKSDIGEFQVSWDISDRLTLSSETAYARDTVYSLQDFNRFNTASGAWRNSDPSDRVREGVIIPGVDGATFCDPQLGCSDRLLAVDVSTAKSRQFSQEFRLASNYEGPFNFSLGANFLRADSEDKYYVFINSLSLIAALGPAQNEYAPYQNGVTDNAECMPNGYEPGNPSSVYPVALCVYMDPNPIGSVNDQGHNYFLSRNPYKLLSYALFGEAYYELSDTLKITGGLRWTVDKKDAPRIPTWILASYSVGYPVADVVEQEWNEPTGRLAIDWKPDLPFTDQTMIYGSYAHGYKAGGANPPGFVRVFYADRAVAQANTNDMATRPLTFDAEFIDAFEIGMKNTLADGRVTLNLAGFYYDYKDYQISEIVDRSAFNRNFDAEIWGVEVEADWKALENLKFGFKGGWQKTRIADGEKAIDLMDRTAGRSDWVIVRPFPTFASSCVLPVSLFVHDGEFNNLGGIGGGNPGACELAYVQGLDPVTRDEYVADPPPPYPFGSYVDYPGFDPFDASQGHNYGEGFAKDLSGNELPNAPEFTATLTMDYTLPLPRDWLATLHTDLHWQSESWWRIFNDHEYNRLDEYFTMNLAAIFTNEEAGWKVMAYVKNVTDETAITGAFLNSDDTGLTTNVFLTEPRLYGVRITKDWTGGPLLGSLGDNETGGSFVLELGGQVQRHDAPNGFLAPEFVDEFASPLDIFEDAQERDVDWGDGRDVKLTWKPGGNWKVSAGVRFGRTNGHATADASELIGPVCALGGVYAPYCELLADDPDVGFLTRISRTNRADASVRDRERHQIVDFAVGTDVGFGSLSRSEFSLGLRHAALESDTDAQLRGVPDWEIPAGFYPNDSIFHTVYRIDVEADRAFRGAGPVVSWDASLPLADWQDAGRVELDWSVSAGVLFGSRKTSISGRQEGGSIETTSFQIRFPDNAPPANPVVTNGPPVSISRASDATVPTFSASLGVAYDIGSFRLGAGYRWERYFDAIDGGFDEAAKYDRTIDGPYFKIAMGFGG